MDPVHLRIRDDALLVAQIEVKKHESDVPRHSASVILSYIKILVVAHASLLLERMGSTHLVATVAARLLREET